MRGYISALKQPVSIFPQGDIVVIPEEFGEHGFAEPPGSEKHGYSGTAVFINLKKTGLIYESAVILNNVLKDRHSNRDFFGHYKNLFVLAVVKPQAFIFISVFRVTSMISEITRFAW